MNLINFIIICQFREIRIMGQIVEGMRVITLWQSSSKNKSLNLQEYVIKAQDSNGNYILRLQDSTLGLFVVRQFSKSNYITIKQDFFRWIQNNSKQSCNVIYYDARVQSLFCNSHITFKMIMQYGDRTLYQILKQQNFQKSLDQSAITLRQDLQISKPLQMLKIFKFMIDTVEEQRLRGTKQLDFHNKNIIYFKKDGNFKYLNMPICQGLQEIETFFSPQKYRGIPNLYQQSTIFSMGMVLMSILLGQDCSDCYNYQNLTFCQSIFEGKLQKLNQISIQKGFFNVLDQETSMYVPQFQMQMSELIFSMTAPYEERMTFQDLKKHYYRILKRLSYGYQMNNCQSSSRLILEPIPVRNGNRTSFKKAIDTSIRCSSTHQFICGNSADNKASENTKKKSKRNINLLKVKIPKSISNYGVDSKVRLIKKGGEDKQNINIQEFDYNHN